VKVNKNLIIELLSNELVYERAEHQNTISDFEMEGKYKEIIENELKRNIETKHKIQQVNNDLTKRIEYLEGLIFELGDDLEAVQSDREDLQADYAHQYINNESKFRTIIDEHKKNLNDLQADYALDHVEYWEALNRQVEKSMRDYNENVALQCKVAKLEYDLHETDRRGEI